jgi:uncharacterized membrane protein YhaH (DUF805 family)
MASTANPYAAPRAEVDRADDEDEIEPVQVFSASGRLGRVRYLGYLMGVYLVLTVLVGIFAGFAGFAMAARGAAGARPGAGLIAVIVVVYVALFVALFILAIRRLHDFEASGWWSLLGLLPFVNLIFGLVLLFKPGTDGRNTYGGKTPPNGVGVIILASLMPAFMVLGIVAAIALPAYTGYVKRAQQAQFQAPR